MRKMAKLSLSNIAMISAFVLVFMIVPMIVSHASSNAPEPNLMAAVENHRDMPSVLVFSDGSRFETTLFDVRVLGALRTSYKAPYIVLAGRGCIQCDANISIYIHSPSDGAMRDQGTQPRFTYPGHELSYVDGRTPLYERESSLATVYPDTTMPSSGTSGSGPKPARGRRESSSLGYSTMR